MEAQREAIQRNVTEMLLCLGERPERDGLRDTPKRVAKALLFSLRGNGQSAAGALGTALFTESALAAAEVAVAPAPAELAALSGSEDSEDLFELAPGVAGGDGHGLVVVRRIDIFSTNEEDLQPFFGHCHVAYLPAHGRLVGLSKTARIAEVFARRLQTPQRLAEELAAGLEEVAQPRGVAVLLEASSLRDVSCGAAAAGGEGGRRLYSARRGCFVTEPSWWDEFSALVQLSSPSPLALADSAATAAAATPPLPAAAPAPTPCGCCTAQEGAGAGAEMEGRLQQALLSMLIAAGEPADRPGLAQGCARYAASMRAATEGGRSTLAQALASTEAATAAGEAGSTAAQLLPPPALRVEPPRSGDSSRYDESWELGLPVQSMCEHHLLPFHGACHIALRWARGCSVDRSPLPRAALAAVLDLFARRLQVQERLTAQVAEGVMAALTARLGGAAEGLLGVLVLTEASHLCMASRGVEQRGSSTCSTACLGSYAGDAAARAAFLRAVAAARSAGGGGNGWVADGPTTPRSAW